MQSDPATNPVPGNARTWSGFISGALWLTVGFAVIMASQVAGAVLLGVFEARRSGVMPGADAIELLLQDGDMIGIGFPIAMVLVVLLVVLVVRYRRRRPLAEYLALEPVPAAALARWLAVAAIVMAASTACGLVFDRPDMYEWLETAFLTVDYPLAFALAVALCAPVLEEVLYRGYVLRAWLESRLRPVTAVVLLSAAWALTHFQYDLYDMVWVFILGLLLAYSRIRSGSLYPAIAIHCAWNGTAYIALHLHFSS